MLTTQLTDPELDQLIADAVLLRMRLRDGVDVSQEMESILHRIPDVVSELRRLRGSR